jgi:hypothetical protein
MEAIDKWEVDVSLGMEESLTRARGGGC